MALLFFLPTVLIEIIYAGLFMMTIRHVPPGFRFWPPPGPRSWQFFVAWLLAAIVVVNFFFLGLLDFDSFVLPHFRARVPAALAIFVVGSVIGTWAYASFGLRTTIGLGERLIVRGPYRFSRNPQYIGDSLNILGWIVLTNSWMVGIIGVVGIMLNFLAPFTEEPWLEERFGTEYREYKQKVPRFFW